MTGPVSLSKETLKSMTTRMTRRACSLLAMVLVLWPSLLLAQATDAPASMPEADAPTPTAFDDPALVQQYQATITPEDLASHLYVFASDYFEGRETSTRGQKLAALYLAGQYRKMGLAPKGNAVDHNTYAPEAYFQTVPLYTQRLKRASLLVMNYDEEVARSTYGPGVADGQMYLAFGNMEEIRAGLVFAGYGIADDDLGYNDIAALDKKGINRTGRWMMLLNDEPLANDSTSLLDTADGKPSRWSESPNTKLRALLRGGGMPAGVLLVADLGPRAVDMQEQAMKRAASIKDDLGDLSLTEDGGGGRPFPPIYVISSDLANQMLAPMGRTVAEIKQTIDSSLTPEVFEVPGVLVASAIEQETQEAPSENVAAFIEGSDPALKDEVVVISSHYDHIGIESDGEGDLINNGADDDGSGTVGILEMAEAFMKARQDGYGPRRSILFLNVTGEEKGLLGSRYFTDMDPLHPLDKIVTNLNIDMIGRFDPTHPTESENYVYIIGSNLISQELHDINAKVNEITGTNLELDERFNSKDDPNQFYRRSDHWNFGKHAIPFIFFFTGTHDDYHGVDDEADKIEYDRMARITRLIFATAWQVANQDHPPAVSGEGFN